MNKGEFKISPTSLYLSPSKTKKALKNSTSRLPTVQRVARGLKRKIVDAQRDIKGERKGTYEAAPPANTNKLPAQNCNQMISACNVFCNDIRGGF